MTKAEKLLAKIRNAPQDVRWDELVSFMKREGFKMHSGDGSRYTFKRKSDQLRFTLHRPHGDARVDTGAVKRLIELLNL